MIKATIVFFSGLLNLPVFWQFWLLTLIIINGIIPLFFLFKLPAIITLVSFMVGFFIAIYLTYLFGFEKILALMHAPWIPMVLVSIYLHPGFNYLTPYTLWITLSIIVSIVSIIIDLFDLIKYLKIHNYSRK